MIAGIHQAIARLGIPEGATILEPGCGIGNFLSHGAPGHRFIGIEMDSISGRIAKAIHPQHDIRIENFRDTKLPTDRIDAVVGNVPFADLKLDHRGQKLALHDYFFAKSMDALKSGGVLALVTSRSTRLNSIRRSASRSTPAARPSSSAAAISMRKPVPTSASSRGSPATASRGFRKRTSQRSWKPRVRERSSIRSNGDDVGQWF